MKDSGFGVYRDPDKYPFLTMEKGDSFLVPASHKRTYHGVTSSVNLFNRIRPQGRFFTARITKEGMRIWRTK